ncbi:MAG TPA: PSD1 and planctomycete cytochrome C domain-containing protein [Planctomycetota bacterium]|nr:PSD1 and planctomycete cytochrome C domain-containing protein [Planctomycetota bacterium]
MIRRLPVLLLLAGGTAAADSASDFQDRVLPLLQARCISCHGPEKQKGKLRLDSRAAILKGGENGPAIVPGDPEKSLLIQALRQTHPDIKMPPKEKLPADQIDALAAWIKDGAPWVEAAATTPSGPLGNAWSDPRNPIVRIFGGKRLDLWSLRKIARPALPAVKDEAWVRTPVDRYILAALEAATLRPSPEADRRTLIRRVTVDLTGLPPTPEEVKAFLEDPAADAYERLVERLLAGPRYGERWARHWMDIVRYADTNGWERDEFQTQIWRYRDYLIRSFNEDKSYFQFLSEQIAGDELRPGDPDALVATGYLRLGPYDSTGSIFMEDAKNRNELLGDLANTTGSAFLGLTMACANCHDHKYDPISQADHFRLRSFFAGVKRQDDTILDPKEDRERIQKHNDAIDARMKGAQVRITEILEPARNCLLENRRGEIPAEILALLDLKKEEQTPEIKQTIKPFAEKLKVSDADATATLSEKLRGELGELNTQIAEEAKKRLEFTRGMTVRDSGAKPPVTNLYYQGDFTQPREEVLPGFISVLDPNPAAVTAPAGLDSSGRRSALAAWIASPENPLPARVIVNRLWHHHFGRGLVATPNDFGFSGSRPTHPELLDALASELFAAGGSLKALHRMILRSATYRQRSGDDPARRAVDPENLLLWRQNPRRLDAEATRDALLAVSGALLKKDSGPPVWPPVPQHLLDAQPGILETKSDEKARERKQEWYTDAVEKTDVRSIFLVQKRVLTIPFMQPFDLPDLNVSCGRRDVTTVAPQALQLLNSAFSERMALAFAARVEKEAGDGEAARVDRALWLALARPPSDAERRRSVEFVRRHRLVDFCRVLLNVNEFVYVD